MIGSTRARTFFGALALPFVLLLVGRTLAAQEPATAREPLFAEPLEGPAIGVYGGIERGNVVAAFAVDSRGVTSESDCGRYERGSESGIVVGALSELPLTSVLGVSAALELAMREASMTYPCVDPAGIRMPDGSIAPARTEFHSRTSHSVLTLQLGATVRPTSLPFIVSIGPTIALATTASYDAREVILTPGEASFVSGGQERQVGSGDFSSGDISVALAASLWYEAPLGGRWSIVPRVAGSIALTHEIAEAGLRTTAVQATLGILYRFPPRESVASPIEAGTAPAR